MRCLVVYSSRTGNTKMVAEAIVAAMPEGTVLAPVEEPPAPDGFDLVCLGFWVDKGGPDAKMASYMESVHGKFVGLFGTLGAWPDSDHARDCMAKARAMLPDNTVLDTFLCQGKVDPKLLAAMAKMQEAQNAHPMTEERKSRIEEAKKHPDAADCANAKACFAAMAQQARELICAK